MGSNTAVLWHQHCSAWMLFRTVTLVFQTGTVLMAIYSTLECCKPIKIKLRSFKGSELIYEKGDGPYHSFDFNYLLIKISSVTL